MVTSLRERNATSCFSAALSIQPVSSTPLAINEVHDSGVEELQNQRDIPTEGRRLYACSGPLPFLLTQKEILESGDRLGRAHPLAEKMIFLADSADQVLRRQL